LRRRLEQKARNEALVREVNERIEEVDKDADERGWAPQGGRFDFLCECGGDAGECGAQIQMTIAEYEQVRSQSDRFAVHPGHEDANLEHVVERHERYVLVDKQGPAERLVEDDGRGAPSQ